MKIKNLILFIIVSFYLGLFFNACTNDSGTEDAEEEIPVDEDDVITTIIDTIEITPVFGDGQTFGFSDLHTYIGAKDDYFGYGVPQIATTIINFAQARENDRVIAIAKVVMELLLPFPKRFRWEINNTRTKIEIEAIPDTVLFYGYSYDISSTPHSIEDLEANVAVNKMLLEEGDYQNLYFEVDSIAARSTMPDSIFQRYIKRGLQRFFAGNTEHITIYNEKGETRITSNPNDVDFSKDKKLEIVAEFKIARATSTFGSVYKLSDGKYLIPKVKPDHK